MYLYYISVVEINKYLHFVGAVNSRLSKYNPPEIPIPLNNDVVPMRAVPRVFLGCSLPLNQSIPPFKSFGCL